MLNELNGGSIGLRSVWGTSSNDVYAVGQLNAQESVILHYDGSSWTTMVTVTEAYLSDIWGSSARDIFAVGGKVLHYDGVEWKEMVVPDLLYRHFYAVWGSSSSDVYAVGECCIASANYSYGIIFHYDGQIWRAVLQGGSPRLLDVWSSSSADVYAVGFQDNFWGHPSGDPALHYDGVEWKALPLYTDTLTGGFVAVWGTGHDDVFVSGSSFNVTFPPPPHRNQLRHYDGRSWVVMPYPTTFPYDGWASSKSDVFAVGGLSVLHYGVPPQPDLTIKKRGNGAGEVLTHTGIICDAGCSEVTQAFELCEATTLTATALGGSTFTGWSGACSGVGPCIINMDMTKSVTATFGVEGEVAPQANTMYYGPHLKVEHNVTASGSPAATQLVVFVGAVPPGIYLVDVAGAEHYDDTLSVYRLANRLLRTGCAGGPCSIVNCTYYKPDGTRTDCTISEPTITDNIYLPFAGRR